MRLRFPRSLHELRDKGEHVFHMTYLGFTYVEGHGMHAATAGILFLVVLSGVFIGGGE